MSGKEIVSRGKDGICYANKKYLSVHIQDCLGTTDINIAKEVLRDLMAEVRFGRYNLWKQNFNKDWVPRYESKLVHLPKTQKERARGILTKHLIPFFKGRRMGEVLALEDHNNPDFIPLVVRYKLHREAEGAPESTLKKELKVLRDIIRLVDKAFPFPTARTEPLMKIRNKGKVITETLRYDQVLALAEAVYCKYCLPWLTCNYTGLRLADICGLTLDNFLREAGWIKGIQCKTGEPFQVPIHCVLQEEVLDHIPALARRNVKIVSIKKTDREEKLFPDANPRAMANAIIRAANVLNLREGSGETRVSAHWSRHFYATTLANAEVPDDLIAMALGHKRRNITQGYIHRNKNRLAEYVECAFLELRGCANGVQIENAVQQSGSK
jgi:integrase